MKKLVALLLACMMLLTAGVAMAEGTVYSAYDPISLADETAAEAIRPITHGLTLVEGATELPNDIEYTFTVGDLTVVKPEGMNTTDYVNMVTGAPSFSDANKTITYTTADFESGSTATKTLNIDWSAVTVKEPGVYRWTLTKVMATDSERKPSNDNEISYLFVSVINVNGSLKVHSANLTTDENYSNKGALADTYPAQKLNLSVAKVVSGNQGSKSQYFEFTVQLKLPTSVETPINITGISATVPATVYHGTKQNILTFTPQSDSDYTHTATFWMKHGETAVISGLPYGASYNITENDATCKDYTGVTNAVVGDTEGIPEDRNSYSVTDGKLTGNTTVTFTNTKETTVPTGIDLQTGAPIMGLLLAASMLLMLFISKRREAAE